MIYIAPRHVTVSTVGVLKYMYRLTEDIPNINLALSLHAPNQEIRLKIVPTASNAKIHQLLEAMANHIKHNKLSLKNESKLNSKVDSKINLKIDFTESKNESNDLRSNTTDLNVDSNVNEQFDSIIESNVELKSNSKSKASCVMIEYILIDNINNLPIHAIELSQLLLPYKDNILLNLIPYNPTNVTDLFHPPSSDSVNEFATICKSKPYEIHTRVRQEMGQDISGACGQLAVVSKSKENKHIDMEDYGSSNATHKKTKNMKTKIPNSIQVSRNFNRYYHFTLHLLLPIIAFAIIINKSNK